MRIAFFHNLPSGGAQRVVYEQIRHLQKGNSIALYTIYSDEKSFLDFTKLTCTIKQYNFPSPKNIHGLVDRALYDYGHFYTLAKLHKKIAIDMDLQQYDLIIVHPDSFTQSPYLLQFLKTKNIYYCHELLRMVYEKKFAFKEKVRLHKKTYEALTRHLRKKIDKQNATSAQKIIANSHFIASNIKNAYQKNAGVCYPGVDADMFKPLRIQKKYDILFIGGKSAINGYDLLEKSISLLEKNPSIKFLDQSTRKKWAADEDLVKKYNLARIVLCLTRDEPFGMIPLEAMACEVPVIAIDEGGYTETIVSDKTGLLVNHDVKNVSGAIKKLLTDDKLRKTLGRNGRMHIIKNFSWRKHVDQLLEFVSEK